MSKIKVIIKRPDEHHGHVTWISDTLENLQKTVEGYIEVIPSIDGMKIICNEEGKLMNLPSNMSIGIPGREDILCGTIIVCRIKSDKFASIKDDDFKKWKEHFIE